MKLTKIPKLKSGNDEKVAAKLDELVIDANEGLRRIIRAGFLLERIAADLKHGEFKPWIEAHCKASSRASIFGWRLLARNIMETVKLSKSLMLDFSLPMEDMLALPPAEVPKEQKEIRAKIDALIEGKSARQLFSEFKQTDGPDADGNMKSRRGRLKGQGGATAAQRAKAKAAQEASEIAGMESWADDVIEYITQHADDNQWGRIDTKKKQKLLEAFLVGIDYLKQSK